MQVASNKRLEKVALTKEFSGDNSIVQQNLVRTGTFKSDATSNYQPK
jgi:hypothetical protein